MTAVEGKPVQVGGAARWIGQSVPRREDTRLLTGRGRYIDDVTLPGMVHATFVRSTMPRGTIASIDVEAARDSEGVVAVLTAADVNHQAKAFWHTTGGPDSVTAPMRVLADGDVRYVGEPIAIVVAESRYLAEDAAELVEVDIDPLPPVLDAYDALADGAPLVHKELESNLAGDAPMDVPGIDERIDAAAHRFDVTFGQHRYVNVPMETRGLVASWDPWTGQLELRIAGQGVHEPRLFYSRLLGIPESRIRVQMGDVGGSFGQKMYQHREEHAVIIAARTIGARPVKWIEDRAENLVAGGHARQEAMEVAVGTDEEGRFLVGKVRHVENVGAFPAGANGQNAGFAGVIMPGPYRWTGPGSFSFHGHAAFTNTCGTCAYRGPWMMETVAREQMVDHIARKLGVDPLELRRRNVIASSELPFTTPMQLSYETISPAETLEQAAELIGYDAFRAQQEKARAEGRLLGVGLSLYVEPQPGFGNLGSEGATIRIEPSGVVNAYLSTGSHGQSLETTLAQIVADELGVAIDDVRVIQGDTASSPYGAGTGGSRSAAIASGAAHAAGAAMREKVLAIAAHMLEASVDDVEMRDGVASVRGVPTATVPLADIAATAYLNTDALPPGIAGGLEVSERYKAPLFMFSNACHAVTVEVDAVTGQVEILRYVVSEDCGNMINPMVVEGQIMGGVAQAVGGVLYEHMMYDPDGNPTTTTFLDYLVPTAAEIPDVEYGHIVTPATTPGGYKGLGEGGAIVGPAAIINAVNDALAHLGIEIHDQPLTPAKIASHIAAATNA